jgi:hypothetical protein
MAFNLFSSLAPNSIDTWPSLEQKFHDYFYNGEVELRFSDLTAVRQKYNETVPKYLKRFGETHNRCYDFYRRERPCRPCLFRFIFSAEGKKWKVTISPM